MSEYDLSNDGGLRAACESIGPLRQWGTDAEQWIRHVASTLERIRGAGEEERSSADFQEWLWEDNNIAAVGQGTIPVDRGIEDLSQRLHDDYSNGQSYYPLHGQPVSIPTRVDERPDKGLLLWHNERVFLG